MRKWIYYFLFIHLLFACGDSNKNKTLFKKINQDHHGIGFQNTIAETDSLNILTLEYIYNGGGVAIADFNQDGLSDIFFTANIVANRLYLNKGELRFEDVTERAGLMGEEKWRSGVAVADVNSDGWPDIYVCATVKRDSTKRINMLYIHQGLDKNGVPFFKDEATNYGLDYNGYSSGAAFLDYDNDSDLDLYILTNTIQKGIPTSYRQKINDGSTVNTDRLYRNNGNNTFTDVSTEAGIVHEGYGLGVAIADINQDGWPDIYVSNDYVTNDLLYLNNKNGTFTNAIDQCIKHQSQFSMGNDVADINNDGLPDIITLDMLPEGNLRRKTVIHSPNYTSYINNEKYGYGHQYTRNMLQLNNGNGTFSEIGQLAGIHQTEWSWSPLFADVDNDGFRDLLVTNGFPRDITDRDFGNFRNGPAGNIASIEFFLDSIPVVKVPNYAFKNNGDLTFTDATQSWGMFEPSFSNGAAVADLDNDGDLDYVVNNINSEIFLYENTLYSAGEKESNTKHYLRIKLEGKEKNKLGNRSGNESGLGASVKIHYNHGKMQYAYHSVYRGYLSTVEDVIHFGLDTVSSVDTLVVEWPDGNRNTLFNVKADQVLKVSHKNAAPYTVNEQVDKAVPLLKEITAQTGIRYVHQEDDKIDFNLQRTIPHKFSQSGPGIAVGDINADGLDDFYVGGSAHHSGILYQQSKNGTFKSKELKKSKTSDEEDQGALFFDSDNDGDQDLYVVSGTFEYPPDSEKHQDRLYNNDGNGNFTLNLAALPSTTSSGSCVRAADIDADGDLDLFVGGRIVPGQFPYPAENYLLVNEDGVFKNKISEWCPALQSVGMITDAIWTDVDSDNIVDLIVVGEFMPITVYKNNGKQLSKTNSGLEGFSGWWNSIAGADFDSDGDVDFIAGNLGLNNYYKASPQTPIRVYASDLDGNNSVDAVLTCYLKSEQGDKKEFPIHFWDELNSQSPAFRHRFDFYKQYGKATIDKVLTEAERKKSLMLEANCTSSSYIENIGQGQFKISPLPILAQVAPVNGIITDDFNSDGHSDVLLVGNDYGNEVFSGRYDAFTGLVLLGDGHGNFKTIPSASSGFLVDKDAKALARLSRPEKDVYLATQNRDSLKVFSKTNEVNTSIFKPNKLDVCANLLYTNGKKQRVEFYYGSGYLSQSTRQLRIPKDVEELIVYDSKGKSRKIKYGLVK
jgi:enediyne biosynthesis protein E4